jgi:hypothetical protein
MARKILIGLLALLVVAAAGFVIWASAALGPSQQALAAMNSSGGITVENVSGWTVFRPDNTQPTTGFIFYPGGKVEYRSYAPLLRLIAAQGYEVVLVPMPLNLAIFGIDKARDVIKAFPQVKTWAIGGHSLGGSMAAQFVGSNPGIVQGLVFWASYPGASLSSAPGLKVLSVSGSQDGLATPAAIDSSKKDLPPGTSYEVIKGGNHGQFGSYGDQPGDNQASIPPEEQWAQVAAATAALLNEIGQ